MKFITYFLVLFLSFLTKSLSSSTPKGRESIFSYHANIDTRNSACNHGLARWILSGKLRAQHFNGSLVLKLDDLKTSIFNGPRENITLALEKEIPEDAEILMEPFIIHKEDDGQISISVQPGELLWSLNMKRGIASNFQIDIEKVKSTKLNIKEKSVHGECDVAYKVLPSKGSDEIIHKTIDYKKCSNKPIKHVANVRPGPKPADFNSIKMKTLKAYTIRETNGVSEIHKIHSISQLTYQVMPKSPTTQHIDQYQEFDLQEMKTIIEEPIDISKITVKKDIIFEYEKKDFEKEKEYSLDLKELKEQFYTNYDKFMKKMNTIPLENHKMSGTDYVEEMFAALTGMTAEDYKNVEEEFTRENKIMELYIFWSLLPYVGSEQAMNYIVNYEYIYDQEDVKLNEQVFWRSLLTFPTYITFPLDNKIESLEVLLSFQNSDNTPIGNIGKLSFATIVANGVEKKLLNKNNADKYIKLFHEHFLDNTEKYENRMTYLLGLVNMADILTVESMLEIITNTTENSNLRVLAIVGFKKNLISSTNKLFDTIWPIVQNSTEAVEMRIRALDLILSSNISQEQFNVILDTLLGKNTNLYGHTINMNDKHILHYFITTLRSFRNAEPFQSPLIAKKYCTQHDLKVSLLGSQASKARLRLVLEYACSPNKVSLSGLVTGSFADNALKNNSFPDYSRYWTSGNYRISYNDDEPNIGTSLQAQFIGDPNINSLDVLHFTYNQFALSFEGTYELYLKIRGVPKFMFMKKFMTLKPNATSIPELLDLVKKFKFEIKDLENELHIEIVILIDGRVVYAAYDNLENVRRIVNLVEYEAVTFFIEQPIQIWYPVLDYTYIPSDLGTELTIMHDMEDIRIKKIVQTTDVLQTQYRSSWYSQLWVESFNPIINSIIGTYKYFGDEKIIKINKNLSSPIIERKNDTLNWVWDKVMGTVLLNGDARKEYCPKCKHFNEIEIKNKENQINDAEYLGIKFNYTVWKVEDDNPNGLFQEFISTHRSNTMSLPLAKPLLVILHYANFLYYFKQDLLRGNVRTIDFYDSPGYLTLDYDIGVKGFSGMNPFKDGELFFTMHLNNSEPDNESLIWNATFNSKYLPKCTEYNETKFKVLQTFNFEYYLQNSSTYIVNAKRELLFPDMNPNKFSSVQPEPGIGKCKLVFGRVEEPEIYLLYENFTNTNEQISKVKEMTQYEECKQDAVDYEFIPPTVSCLTVFAAMSEYTHYKIDLEKVNLSNSQPVRYLDVSRLEKDKLKIIMPEDKFGLILNQPYRIYDPTAMAYHDMDILVGSSRTCIITSKQLKTFEGNNIPFEGESGAVFIECINKTCLRGVAVDKLSDKKMGFKLWSNENSVTATLVDSKLLVTLNGGPIDESVDLENFEIHFMADNVIYIIDDHIHFYYNTEYMYIKAKTIYAALTTGFCNM